MKCLMTTKFCQAAMWDGYKNTMLLPSKVSITLVWEFYYNMTFLSNLKNKDHHEIKIHWVHMLFTSFVNVPEIGKSCHYLHSPRQPTWFIINAGNSQRWQRFSWPNKLTPIHPSDAEYLSICRVIMFMNGVLNHLWDFSWNEILMTS